MHIDSDLFYPSNIDKGPATVKASIGGVSFMVTPARAKMILELQKSIREQQKKEAKQ